MCSFLLGAREAPNVLCSRTSPEALYLSLLWGKRNQYVQSASMIKKEYVKGRYKGKGISHCFPSNSAVHPNKESNRIRHCFSTTIVS
ncbi:hypothetical protein AMTRI_Chr11g94380 [Amborella trichopoda]